MLLKIRVRSNMGLQGGFQETAEWTLTQAVSQLVMTGMATCEEVADLGGWAVAVVRAKKTAMEYVRPGYG